MSFLQLKYNLFAISYAIFNDNRTAEFITKLQTKLQRKATKST